MSPLQVTPAAQTGHRDIDGQVRTLFSLANEVLFAKELEESPDRFQRGLRLFVAYLYYHFASEELVMAECHYPARLVHSDVHARILNEATTIEDRTSRGGSLVEARHALLFTVICCALTVELLRPLKLVKTLPNRTFSSVSVSFIGSIPLAQLTNWALVMPLAPLSEISTACWA